MRVHWEKCLKIPLSDGYHMLVLPDSTKDPARKVKLAVAVAGYTGGKAFGRAILGPLFPMPLTVNPKPVEVSDDSEGEPEASITFQCLFET